MVFGKKKPWDSHYSLFILVNSAVILALSFSPVAAKKLDEPFLKPPTYSHSSKVSSVGLYNSTADLEDRLRPFLEQRLNHSKTTNAPVLNRSPSETDVLLLARMMNQLSPEFNALYKAAISIPDYFAMHKSPGGHFEIYYTIADTSQDAVSKIDTIGYGNGIDWWPRTHASNGVPDYVDEVAWALDSAWSMEIDKFGFMPPLPDKDAVHTSNLFKVSVRNLGPGAYGYSWCGDPAQGSTKGFTSYIEIRNQWESSVWSSLGYDIHPENGIRITCAHEFFHAIQYGMTWDVVNSSELDDYPIGWLEGTAVLMEELAFNSINDYLQYSQPFFSNPSMSFFSNNFSMTIYANALLAKFMVEKAPANGSIELIKNPFFRNYDTMTPFDPNLRAVSLAAGMPWVNILNAFHTGSYYSGTRADTTLFLADAALLDTWALAGDSLPLSDSLIKSVLSYAMNAFSFTPLPRQSDTITVLVRGEVPLSDTLPYPQWAARAIVRKTGRPDSIFQLGFDSLGRAQFVLANWHQQNNLSIIVSNGNPSTARNVTTSIFSDHQLSTKNQPLFSQHPILITKGSGQSLVFSGQGIQEIHIFDINGKQVADTRSFQKSSNGFAWNPGTIPGGFISQGCRIAIVTYAEPKSSKRHRSMMTIPIIH